MWMLTVRSPSSSPIEYQIKQGKNTLGRKPDNHIIIADVSASRNHAEVYCQNELAIISDLGSTNGTFVNRERIIKPQSLKSGDQIRIGQHMIDVSYQENGASPDLVTALSGTRPFTRDLLLESIDQHAILMDVVASRLTMILDLETALKEIAELTRLAVGADKTGVITVENFDQLRGLDLPRRITQQAIEQRSIVIIPSLTSEADRSKKGSVQPFIGSVLCVPVMIDQEVAALIYAYKTSPGARPFDRHDVQLAVAISHQAALTIQRSNLIEESRKFEQLATIDSLTGLNNRRQIMQLAELEFQRARRFHHPMSVLVLDLDGLKQINDTFGHLVGDRALQLVAEQGKKQIREVDSFGRIGGDEFTILLVETALEGARTTAERIHHNITKKPIDTQHDSFYVTVSIGVASLDEKHTSLNDLLAQADEALIKAKKAGKDQILVSP
jgi:diguanylate cyclase (GGDEF)-like protein